MHGDRGRGKSRSRSRSRSRSSGRRRGPNRGGSGSFRLGPRALTGCSVHVIRGTG